MSRLHFTAPSFTSGEDYAVAVAGNAWDMDDSADIQSTDDVADLTFSGGEARFRNTSNDSKVLFNVPVPIDSGYYRYFTYRFWIEGTRDLGPVGGWVGRVIWHGPGGYPVDRAITQDWELREGWYTYTLDLATVELEIESLGSTTTWTGTQPHILRLTPNEGTLSQWMHLDYAKLTARSRADSFFAIQWDLVNPDSDPITTTLYYDTDTDPDNGKTLITTLPTVGVSCSGQGRVSRVSYGHSPGISSSDPYTYFLHLPWVTQHYYACSGNCYVWGTSSVAAGDYYVYAELDDGYNVTSWYSETPVEIRH